MRRIGDQCGEAAVGSVGGLRAEAALGAVGDQRGQATVEFVALMPVMAALVAAVWQAALAGQAVWAVTSAARAAARAEAIGADARRAARSHLPESLERGLRVSTRAGGEVRVSVRIPAIPGLPSPGRARAGARFEPQS